MLNARSDSMSCRLRTPLAVIASLCLLLCGASASAQVKATPEAKEIYNALPLKQRHEFREAAIRWGNAKAADKPAELARLQRLCSECELALRKGPPAYVLVSIETVDKQLSKPAGFERHSDIHLNSIEPPGGGGKVGNNPTGGGNKTKP